MRILLIEDERHIAEALVSILQKNKYIVDHVANGEDGLSFALAGVYDIIILDIMLPKMRGTQVLKEFRKQNKITPVIILTALSDVSDKIIGLDLGADDYIPKPFNTDELLARIRAVSRRKSEIISQDHIYSCEDITLDTRKLELYSQTEECTLTLKESQLLEYMIVNYQLILSKEKIIDKIWNYDSDTKDNHVEVYISFLRKKLLYIKSNISIKTLRGAGYKLCLKD